MRRKCRAGLWSYAGSLLLRLWLSFQSRGSLPLARIWGVFTWLPSASRVPKPLAGPEPKKAVSGVRKLPVFSRGIKLCESNRYRLGGGCLLLNCFDSRELQRDFKCIRLRLTKRVRLGGECARNSNPLSCILVLTVTGSFTLSNLGKT